eukprot:gene9698-biopygen4725
MLAPRPAHWRVGAAGKDEESGADGRECTIRTV